jgi:DNA polymerase-3 subunit epsilon
MAVAMFAGHAGFARDAAGRWRLTSRPHDAELFPSALPLASESYVVVDVEATGSRAYHGDRITEIAAVRVCDGKATTVFESLINPRRPIPRQISRLTNISSDMVRRAPTFSDVCDALLGVLEGSIFVAHNADFDWRFINMEVQRVTGRRLDGRRLCTVHMARHLLPDVRLRSLDRLSWHYGIENVARHRAGGDAKATAEVLLRLFGEAESRGVETFADLEQLLVDLPSTKRRRRRRRRAMPHAVAHDTTA